MSKPINPLCAETPYAEVPQWAKIIYESLGITPFNDVTLEMQAKPFGLLTEEHQQALKDAHEEGYQIWWWGKSGRWCKTDLPLWFSIHSYAVGELREEFREPEDHPLEEAFKSGKRIEFLKPFWTAEGVVHVWEETMNPIWSHSVEYRLVGTGPRLEEPEFKLFELIWRGNGQPKIQDKNGQYRNASNYQKVDGYRLFGFTDDPNWSQRFTPHFSPADATGVRKYVIGRLEK